MLISQPTPAERNPQNERNMKKTPQLINYVSGVPGLGKTHWVIDRLVESALNGDELTIYVGPTKALLQQVIKDVKKRLTGHMSDKRINRLLIPMWSDEKGTVGDNLRATVNETKTKEGTKLKKMLKGSILFMAHEGFVRIDDSQLSPEIRSKADVYFDEAKKTVFQRTAFPKLPEQGTELFNKVFNQYQYRDTPYSRLTLKYPIQKCEELLRSTELSYPVKRIFSNMFAEVDNPRLEVYTQMRSFNAGMGIFEVRLPSLIFKGFKSVCLLSAFFEESQMYALLYNSAQFELKNITGQIPNYGKRMERILKRYAKIDIVPLTAERLVVSKHRLSRKFMVPQAFIEPLNHRITTMGISAKELRDIHMAFGDRRHQIEFSIDQKILSEDLSKVPRFSADPAQWYIESARKVIERWSIKNPQQKAPIIFLNNAIAKKNERNLQDFQLASIHSHGLNSYKTSNIAVFLAAVNPTPGLHRFLHSKLEGYDVHRDHVLDVCTQCISRSSIRDPKSKERVLVIVPDTKMVELLQTRFTSMNVDSRYLTRLGNMVSFDPADAISAKRRAKKARTLEEYGSTEEYNRSRKREDQRRYREDPTRALIASLSSKRSYHKRRNNHVLVDSLTKEIEALRLKIKNSEK